MLCSNVCEPMSAGATVYADFVEGVVDSLSVSGQRSVMAATKPADVNTVRMW